MIQTAMVLAAGLGKRMRPLTNTCPKPLIPVAGKTMLARTLDHLQDAGITRIVVNTHYLAPLVESALPPDIRVSREDSLLETGGGVKKALPLLQDDVFFVLNGDSVWTGENILDPLRAIWDSTKMDVLLLLVPHEKAHGYTGRGDFFLSSDQTLRRPAQNEQAPYVYVGIHLVHARLFKEAPEGAFSLNVLWDKAVSAGRLFGAMHEGDWFHISTPECLERYSSSIQEQEA